VNTFQKLLAPFALVAVLATACTAPTTSDAATGSSDLVQDDGS